MSKLKKDIDSYTTKDLLLCPIHNTLPTHELTDGETGWVGYVTYCPICDKMFCNIWNMGKGTYYHELWQLSQRNPGTKSASIYLWNRTVEDVNKTLPDNLILLDILSMDYMHE